MTTPLSHESADAQADAQLDALLERAKHSRLRRSKREYPNETEAIPAVSAFVRRYRAGDDLQRTQARARVKGSQDLMNWLLFLSSALRHEFERTRELEHAELALCALSLEDASLDPRDSQLALGMLWHRLTRADVDPRPLFDAVAALSSPGEQGFAATLRGFESSAFFRDEVAPFLAQSELRFEKE